MKALRKGLAILLVLITLLPVLSITALADPDGDPAGEPATPVGEGLSIGFYEMASTGSTYLSDAIAKATTENLNVMGGVNSCSAGGLLGYSDAADESGVISKWITSQVSSSSATFSYDAIRKLSGDNDESSFYNYVKYGQLLNRVGFDSVANQSGGILRKAGGMFMSFVYVISRFMANCMNGVISIMKFLNPFALIDTRFMGSNIAGIDYVSDGGPLQELAKWLGGIYKAMYNNIATFVFAVMFIILVIQLLFMNAASVQGRENLKKVKSFVIKGVAMFIGVPLCATLYTTCLDELDNMSSNSNFAASRVIASTFLDFEEWARQFQLGTPRYHTYNVTDTSNGEVHLQYEVAMSGQVSALTYLNLQKSCYNINRAVWHAAGRVTEKDSEPMSYAVDSNSAMVSGVGAGTDVFSTATEQYNDGMSEVIDDLLERYSNGEFYYPSSWEVDAKGRVGSIGGGDTELAKVMRESSSTVSKFTNSVINDNLLGADGIDKFWGADGRLTWNSTNWEKKSFSSARGLSDMALYNYLTSEFGNNSLTVYSSEKASSGYVRKAHYSVNLIGGGVLGFLFYCNTLILIFDMGFIGLFYGLAILFSNFKRMYLSIISIFWTVGGSLKGFAKLLTYTVVMILEVLGTFAAYLISTELLMSLNQIVLTPIMYVVSAASSANLDDVIQNGIATVNHGTLAAALGGFLGAAGKPVLMVSLAINIIILIIFSIIAAKMRNSIVKTIEEIASAGIDKLLGVQHQDLAGGSPSLGGRMAGAAAAGMGAAVAQRAFGGSDNSGDGSGTKGTASAEDDDTRPPDGKDGDGKDGKDGAGKDGSGKDGSGKDTKAGDAAGGSGGDGADGKGGAGADGADGAGAAFDDGESSADDDEEAAVKNAMANGDVNSLDDVGKKDDNKSGSGSDDAKPVSPSGDNDAGDKKQADDNNDSGKSGTGDSADKSGSGDTPKKTEAGDSANAGGKSDNDASKKQDSDGKGQDGKSKDDASKKSEDKQKANANGNTNANAQTKGAKAGDPAGPSSKTGGSKDDSTNPELKQEGDAEKSDGIPVKGAESGESGAPSKSGSAGAGSDGAGSNGENRELAAVGADTGSRDAKAGESGTLSRKFDPKNPGSAGGSGSSDDGSESGSGDGAGTGDGSGSDGGTGASGDGSGPRKIEGDSGSGADAGAGSDSKDSGTKNGPDGSGNGPVSPKGPNAAGSGKSGKPGKPGGPGSKPGKPGKSGGAGGSARRPESASGGRGASEIEIHEESEEFSAEHASFSRGGGEPMTGFAPGETVIEVPGYELENGDFVATGEPTVVSGGSESQGADSRGVAVDSSKPSDTGNGPESSGGGGSEPGPSAPKGPSGGPAPSGGSGSGPAASGGSGGAAPAGGGSASSGGGSSSSSGDGPRNAKAGAASKASKPRKAPMSDTTKAALTAAVGSFMASSDNKIVSSLGQGVNQVAAIEIASNIQGARQGGQGGDVTEIRTEETVTEVRTTSSAVASNTTVVSGGVAPAAGGAPATPVAASGIVGSSTSSVASGTETVSVHKVRREVITKGGSGRGGSGKSASGKSAAPAQGGSRASDDPLNNSDVSASLSRVNHRKRSRTIKKKTLDGGPNKSGGDSLDTL